MARNPRLTVFEDDDFGVSHCADVDVPGYLILAVKGSARGWSDAADRQLVRLGGLIGRVVAALAAVAGPERIYVCAFGEETPGLHFHLFPRYAWMGGLLGERTGDGPIDGPALLSLIRRERACAPHAWSDPAAVRAIVRSLRRRLAAQGEGNQARGEGC